MININVFSKNHPNGERNRGCVKSPELLKRIDKALAAKEISAKELDELEKDIRCTNQCFVPRWLMADLYDTAGVSVKISEPVKPAKEITKPTEKPIDKPEITEPISNGEPTVSGDYQADKVPETIIPEGDGEPTHEPIEPVGEGIPGGEPVPAESETPAETEQPVEVSDEPQSEENTMETETPDENPTESPAESETPAETEQPKTRRSRKKAEEAAE